MLDFFRRWFQPKPQPDVADIVTPPPPPKREPRGIRNNNPGNVRYTGEKWQGLIGVDSAGFCRFDTPQSGIRALCIVLRNYERKHRLDTIRGMITRWAPPSENDTAAYISAVARALDVDPDERINVHDRTMLGALVRAIVYHENGKQPYPPGVVMAGVDAALLA